MDIVEAARVAGAALQEHLAGRRPQVGVILGSGLTPKKLPLENPLEIPTAEIPGLPLPTVAGHRAVWTAAELGGVPILIAGGRTHGYEGVPLSVATLGVRAMRRAGCTSLVVTNAAGGIHPDFSPGTLMRLRDHLNMLGDSPLVGDHHEDLGARFVDMTGVYDAEWGAAAMAAASELGIAMQEGVYAACLGPQYETPAEVQMLKALGADAVGMSTVPEVIVARHMDMRVLGLSIITDACLPDALEPVDVSRIIEAASAAEPHLTRLIERVVGQI